MNKLIKTTILLFFLIASTYILWVFFGKSVYLNHTPRYIHIGSLYNQKWIVLSKWEDQKAGHTFGLELEISGTTNKNLTFLFGPEKNGLMQQVLLKKGSIDFEFASDWYSDSCYLYFPTNPGSNINLTISYQFMGNAE